MDNTDIRLQQLSQWVEENVHLTGGQIAVASADASFRRYFRLSRQDETYILMDAPPTQEDTRPFINVTLKLEAAGVPVPHIYAKDIEQGFLCLADLGNQSLLSALNDASVDSLYGEALSILTKLKTAKTENLPVYDDAMLHREMELFPDWFLKKHLSIELNELQTSTLTSSFQALAQSALEQPQVFVHRDYHSRNLMLDDNQQLGVIDYQDAVLGPITYDLVSLLKDCYIKWPQSRVEDWALSYKHELEATELLNGCTDESFLRWFDLMGIQRHLKAVGIFARLNHRDGKPGYLNDIPRTLSYICEIAPRCEETQSLADLLNELDIQNRLMA